MYVICEHVPVYMCMCVFICVCAHMYMHYVHYNIELGHSQILQLTCINPSRLMIDLVGQERTNTVQILLFLSG